MRIKLSVEFAPKWPTSMLRDMAGLADELDFDTIWVSDHYHNRNVFVTLAIVASVTHRVRIGPGILSPYVHHPAYIAQAVLTLADLAEGRAVCGIGAGDLISLTQLGLERSSPLRVVRDALFSVRKLLKGESVNVCSPTFKLVGAKIGFEHPDNIPIYVGAQGDGMLKMAARLADGILVNFSDDDALRYAIRLIYRASMDAGRNPSDMDVVAHVPVSISDDVSLAKKAALPYAAYILAGSGDVVLERLGVCIEKASKIRSAVMCMDFQEAKRFVEDDVDKFAVYGTPKQVAERLLDILSLGYEHVLVGPPIGPDPQKAMALLNAEVLPRLRDEED
ncbi:MAG: 5,10-methylenetetrahydromethanopterin reductase [Nitrososphaerota archaeon]